MNLDLLLILCLKAFFFAISIAFLETSMPVPYDCLRLLSKLIKIHPVPVPISKIVIFFLKNVLSIASTSSSVSGLGISVSLLTINFLLQNSFSPSK